MAKDALGNDVKATTWLATHAAGDRSLTQGLKVRCAGRGVDSRWLVGIQQTGGWYGMACTAAAAAAGVGCSVAGGQHGAAGDGGCRTAGSRQPERWRQQVRGNRTAKGLCSLQQLGDC